jgi:hypothetical protein
MTVLSKPIYTFRCDDEPSFVEGFNNNYGEDYRDVHFWCEDEFGQIFDTTPIKIKNRINDGPATYIKWSNQEKCKEEYSYMCWKEIMRVNNKQLKEMKDVKESLLEHLSNNEMFYNERCCMVNAMAYQKKHKNLKVCIGSYGFKIAPGVIDIVWGE